MSVKKGWRQKRQEEEVSLKGEEEAVLLALQTQLSRRIGEGERKRGRERRKRRKAHRTAQRRREGGGDNGVKIEDGVESNLTKETEGGKEKKVHTSERSQSLIITIINVWRDQSVVVVKRGQKVCIACTPPPFRLEVVDFGYASGFVCAKLFTDGSQVDAQLTSVL